MKLTQAQQQAIDHVVGNLQLIACAGSGKTEVVARRVVSLLSAKNVGGDGCIPANIIAFTFTEKAAAELKERIHERCHQSFVEINGLAEMYVGTIHGFCLELLKSEVPQYLKYEVLNDVQQALFVDRHSKTSGLTQSTTLNGQPLKRWVDTRNYVAALAILREDAVIDTAALSGCSVARNLSLYQSLLHQRGYLDYSEILNEAARALEQNNALRERLKARVRHVIVDEYQDLNPVQESIVQMLHSLGANVCVVGDDDQTLYQWRGSDVDNILRFEDRYPPVVQVPLVENFRSSEGIVSVARDAIARLAHRLPKEMQATNAQDFESGDIVALPFGTPQEEAEYIAETCKRLRGLVVRTDAHQRGISWSDVAVLLRSVRRDGQIIADAFAAAKVPYVITGMDNLFSKPEADAARQLFYFLAGRIDTGALTAAWKKADLGLASKALTRAVQNAAKARLEMGHADVGQFQVYNLQRQFVAFLENVALREEAVPDGRGEIVFYNLGKFSQVISDFESIHFHSNPIEKYASFAGFLEHQADEAYPEGWQENSYATPDAVQIMTIHQAKGLQWPAVFIPQLGLGPINRVHGGREL